MKFEKSFFVKQGFVPDDLERFRIAALRDFEIAQDSEHAEVKFHFTYMALVKAGIFCIAREGYRIRSKPGHHQKIVETLSAIMGDKDIQIIGNKMRRDRNADLYDSTGRYNDKEVQEYASFVSAILKKL
jgi:hypothetical protein